MFRVARVRVYRDHGKNTVEEDRYKAWVQVLFEFEEVSRDDERTRIFVDSFATRWKRSLLIF